MYVCKYVHIILAEDICEGTALYLSLMGETISLLVYENIRILAA